MSGLAAATQSVADALSIALRLEQRFDEKLTTPERFLTNYSVRLTSEQESS